MSAVTWVEQELKKQGVPFQEMQHPTAFTAQRVAQCEHVSGHRVAKVVVIMADGRPVELIVPATRRVVLEWVRAMLGAREVRLATEDELARTFADCEIGAMPALRHWPGVEVWVDAAMQVGGDILFQAGTHTDAIRMRCDDWLRLVNPRVARFTEPING
jgi:Ala-tRNA(Pro) deacylase